MNRPDSSERLDTPDLGSAGEGDLDVETLMAEVEAAREQAASHLDDLKRVAADFDNYRKRVAKESAATLDRAAERVVVGLIPALDSFDAALNMEPKGDSERRLYEGMLNTREQLLKALEAEGLHVISSVGEPFDPEVHEPVAGVDGGGTLVVASELRRGYRIGDRVLRAALVTLEPE